MGLLAVFPPLLGAIIAGLAGCRLGNRGSHAVTCAGLIVSALASIWLFFTVGVFHGGAYTVELFTWIASGTFKMSWALRFDTLTVVMLIVVNVVSACVHVYSIGYMSHDHHQPRFMAYLSLFTFCMLMLVTADNLVQMFFGWEGVGLCSYLLINFWYEKPSANAAAIKAFLVNRVGDFGFALGIMTIFVLTGALEFDAIFAAIPAIATRVVVFHGCEINVLTAACLLLFMGAMGKSAQLGLHTWLPDAMEGPTPVSALIHAATMVTAGVFMVTRLSPVFEYSPTTLMVITIVGASTAFVAATIGMTQFDIKRVIAYSTMSQLGYMFFAIGVSAYPAAIFHLMTHGFFKALLFLGAGSVIHAMSGEQDMRKMGGIARLIPTTYVLMWIGSLALAGMPFFAGYYSKDMILESTFAAGTNVGLFAYWIGIAAAAMTAFYSWRLLFLTFHGKSRAEHHVMEHVHESPLVMLAPLVVLALGSITAGFLGYEYFVGDGRSGFWLKSISVLASHDAIAAAHHNLPEWAALLPTVVGVIGIALAFVCYIVCPELPARFVGIIGPVHRFVHAKWYFDEMYDFLFVRPAFVIGKFLWKFGDGKFIDGLGPDGVAGMVHRFAGNVSLFQTGYVFHYAFVMVAGLVSMITWFMMH
ncbi:MAG: NADH-quinone oxidoreductase subunit L [Rhodospirillaceae bacterium]